MTRVSARYLAKRLVYSYLIVVAILTVLFLFMKTRADSMAELTARGAGPQQGNAIRERWAAGEPIWEEFLAFQRNFQTGTFGRSVELTDQTAAVIAARVWPTLTLFGAALVVAFTLGPVVGTYLGWYRGGRLDKTVFTGGILSYSVPSFWVGFLLIWLFWVRLDVLPQQFMFPQFFDGWTVLTTIQQALRHAVLPVVTLSLVSWMGTTVVMRSMVHNEHGEEYVHLAEAKGLEDRAIMFRHVARNALIPLVTQALALLSVLIGGAIVLERVFGWRGLGDLLLFGVETGDWALVFGSFLVLGLFVIAVRFLLDVAYTRLDPRIGFGSTAGRSPAVQYPGGRRALWGAAGVVGSYLLARIVAAGRQPELFETTVNPFGGEGLAGEFDWLPDRQTSLMELGVDPASVSNADLGGAVFFNAQQVPFSMPVQAFEASGGGSGSPGRDTIASTTVKSFDVNFISAAGSPELSALLLAVPAVYALTGITATRKAADRTPLERGLGAAAQWTGCLPLVAAALFVFTFSGPNGVAAANPLYALVLAGVLYPAVCGFLGGYAAGVLTERLG